MAIIRAIYENGVFKPTTPVALPEGSDVVFEPRTVEEEPSILEQELAWVESLKHRTDAEIEEARHRLSALSRPPAPIPEGKTLEDIVVGQVAR